MSHEESPPEEFLPVIRVGCAGWGVPKEHAERFPEAGSHLERYARRFPAVEINSSFYCPHRPATYARWAASVPPGFRFAVKVPREITHLRRLADPEEPLHRFLAECGALEEALGPLLVQIPPGRADPKPSFHHSPQCLIASDAPASHAEMIPGGPECRTRCLRVSRTTASGKHCRTDRKET